MTVNIISTRPKAPVCALFTSESPLRCRAWPVPSHVALPDFETQVGLDFLPARDAEFATSEEDARAAARQPSRQSAAAGGSEESKDTQDTRNQDFVQAHAYRQQELQRREAALERSGITVPGTDRDKPTVTMRVRCGVPVPAGCWATLNCAWAAQPCEQAPCHQMHLQHHHPMQGPLQVHSRDVSNTQRRRHWRPVHVAVTWCCTLYKLLCWLLGIRFDSGVCECLSTTIAEAGA